MISTVLGLSYLKTCTKEKILHLFLLHLFSMLQQSFTHAFSVLFKSRISSVLYNYLNTVSQIEILSSSLSHFYKSQVYTVLILLIKRLISFRLLILLSTNVSDYMSVACKMNLNNQNQMSVTTDLWHTVTSPPYMLP